jgi:hypothetical protein
MPGAETIERVWPLLPAFAKLPILIVGGVVVFRWGTDKLRTTNRRAAGIILLAFGALMLFAGVGPLFVGTGWLFLG